MAKAIKVKAPEPKPALDNTLIEKQLERLLEKCEPNWKELSLDLANLLDDVFMFMYPRTLEESKETHPAQKEYLQKKASQLNKHFFRSKATGMMVSRWENAQFQRVWNRIQESLGQKKQGTTK